MKQLCCSFLCLALVSGSMGPLLGLDELDSRLDPHNASLFQFVRIRYNGYLDFWSMGRWGPPPWMHDYPRAERNFLKILLEMTSIETTTDSYIILDMDDPQIMNHPIVYVSEPGYWNITDKEADNLREYLSRGGFVIFDDFRGVSEWNNLAGAMRKVLPDRSFQELRLDHPVFHCFNDIETLDVVPPYGVPGKPAFHGILDQQGRLLAIANYNNDIGDYWEWADDSLTPVNLSNEAFKFGINYIIYGMTH